MSNFIKTRAVVVEKINFVFWYAILVLQTHRPQYEYRSRLGLSWNFFWAGKLGPGSRLTDIKIIPAAVSVEASEDAVDFSLWAHSECVRLAWVWPDI